MVGCYHATVMPAFLVSDTSTLRDKDVKRNGSGAKTQKTKKNQEGLRAKT